MFALGIFCIYIYLLADSSFYGKICWKQLRIRKILERIYI